MRPTLFTRSLETTIEVEEDRLRQIPYFHHAIIAEKTVKGPPTGQSAIVCYVTRKVPVRHLRPNERVPRRVRLRTPNRAGVRWATTDVVELPGTPKFFGIRGGAGLNAFDGQTGVCTYVRQHAGRGYAATCAHVAYDVTRRLTGPIAVRNRNGGAPVFGTPSNWFAIGPQQNAIDAAIIPIKPQFTYEPLFLQDNNTAIDAFTGFSEGDPLGYFYLVDGMAHPCRVIGKIQTLANIALDAAEYPFRDVWRLSAPSARPGHSGALIFRPTPRGPGRSRCSVRRDRCQRGLGDLGRSVRFRHPHHAHRTALRRLKWQPSLDNPPRIPDGRGP